MEINLKLLYKEGLSKSIIDKYLDKIDIFKLYFEGAFYKNEVLTWQTQQKLLLAINKYVEKYIPVYYQTKTYLENNTKFSKNDLFKFLLNNVDININKIEEIINYLLLKYIIKFEDGYFKYSYCFTNIVTKNDIINYVFYFVNNNDLEKLLNIYSEKSKNRRETYYLINKYKKVYKTEKLISCLNNIEFPIQKDANFLEILYCYINYEIDNDTLSCFTNYKKEDIYILKLIYKILEITSCVTQPKKSLSLFVKSICGASLQKNVMDCNQLFLNNNGEIIKKKTRNIIIELLKQNNRCYMSSVEVENILNKNYNIKKSQRVIKNIMENDKNILNMGHDQFCFFDASSINDETIQKLISVLLTYKGLYNCNFFWKNSLQEFCESHNIVNHTALHNFLKKYVHSENIIYDRMPNIVINYKNNNEFLDDFININSPDSVSNLSKKLNKNYGLQIDSITNVISVIYKKFITNGMLNLHNHKELSDSQLIDLKRYFNNQDIFKREFIQNYIEEAYGKDFFNNSNLKKIGYRVEQSYIIKNELTVEKLILKKIKNNKYYYKNELLEFGINDYNYIYKLVSEKKIIMFFPGKFISIEDLYTTDLTNDDVQSFLKDVECFAINQACFSLKNIIDIFANKYNFLTYLDNTAISSIVLMSEKIKFLHKKYYIYGNNSHALREFLELKINEFPYLSTNQLIEICKQKFDIIFDNNDLLILLKSIITIHIVDNKYIFKNKECYFEYIKNRN